MLENGIKYARSVTTTPGGQQSGASCCILRRTEAGRSVKLSCTENSTYEGNSASSSKVTHIKKKGKTPSRGTLMFSIGALMCSLRDRQFHSYHSLMCPICHFDARPLMMLWRAPESAGDGRRSNTQLWRRGPGLNVTAAAAGIAASPWCPAAVTGKHDYGVQALYTP